MGTTMTIDEARTQKMPGSVALSTRARGVFPDGVTHDSRYMDTFSLYCMRAQGPRKWDVDGNEYIDYFGGHGALLLGHNHPSVVAATHAALAQGTHFGANPPRQLR